MIPCGYTQCIEGDVTIDQCIERTSGRPSTKHYDEVFCCSKFMSIRPGLVFMKGVRQVLGLSVGSELRLLSQLGFVLNLYSQKVT